MKTTVAMILAVAVLGTVARADDAARLKLAGELLGAMEVQKIVEKSFDMVRNIASGRGRMGDDTSTKIQDLIKKELDWDTMKADYARVYAETFTEGELKGLLEFYKSPVGRKYVEKQPELMKRSMEISQQKMQAIMPRIMELAGQGGGRPFPVPGAQPGTAPAASKPAAGGK